MGLNRFYTYNGQILKTAEGNPIGYEYIPWPTDGLIARWGFSGGSLVDSVGSKTFIATGGTPSSISGPGATAAIDISNIYITSTSDDYDVLEGKSFSIVTWLKTNGATSGEGEPLFQFGNSTLNSYGSEYWIDSDDKTTLKHLGFSSYYVFNGGTMIDQWWMLTLIYDFDNGTFKTYNGTSLKYTKTGVSQTGPTYVFTTFRFNKVYDFSTPRNLCVGPTYIYEGVLSEAEISQLYNSGNGM